MRVWALVSLTVLACISTPRAFGPLTLEDAAEQSTDGKRRTSVLLVRDAEQARSRGDLRTSRALITRALRIDGQNPYAFVQLGRLALEESDPRLALVNFEQGQLLFKTIEPTNTRWAARVLRLRAEAHLRLGEHDRAETLKNEAEGIAPSGLSAGR